MAEKINTGEDRSQTLPREKNYLTQVDIIYIF